MHARIPQFSDLIMSRFDRGNLMLDDLLKVSRQIEFQRFRIFCQGAVLSALALYKMPCTSLPSTAAFKAIQLR